MGNLFDIEGGFFRFLTKLGDMVILSVLTFFMCLPVITIGPSITALYYVALKTVRDEEGYVFKSFFKSFKQNFLQGFLLEVILAVLCAVYYFDYGILNNWIAAEGSVVAILIRAMLIGFMLVTLVASMYVFPILAKFENKTLRICMNAIMMGIRHLPSSIMMILITAALAFVTYMYPIALIFTIGAMAFLNSFLLNRIFDFYIPKDDRNPDEYHVEEAVAQMESEKEKEQEEL